MPASDDETAVAPLHEGMRKPNLNSQQRRDIVQALLLMVVPGDVELKLMLGAIKSVSETFHVDQKTIRKIWQRACERQQSRYEDLNIFTKERRKFRSSSTVD